MKCYVFAYGTLLDSQIRFEILGYPTTLTESTITGFRLEEINLNGTNYPILVEDTHNMESINGGYFEIDLDDLEKIDAYESEAYLRKLINTDNARTTWVYYR